MSASFVRLLSSRPILLCPGILEFLFIKKIPPAPVFYNGVILHIRSTSSRRVKK